MFELRKNMATIVGVSLFWIALFVAYALFTQRQPPPQSIEIIATTPTSTENACNDTSTPEPTATPAPLRVYVSGAVQSPGVYRLPPDSLVVDAIEQAGGATEDADLVAINLAHSLKDGEQIHVPQIQENAPTPAPITRTDTGSEPDASISDEGGPQVLIDINTASQEALESLPGIGPAMAQRIIDGRPYSTVDDLLKVKGIGEAKLEKIRDYVIVR